MDDTKYAYLAGILDGEGSIQLDPYKGLWRPAVNVTSTDYELMGWLKDNFGGVITAKRTYKDHHKSSWCWTVVNHIALAVLSVARPYMQIERKQKRADLLLDDYQDCTPRNGKYTEEMMAKKVALVERFRTF